jgi:hypothetical protein
MARYKPQDHNSLLLPVVLSEQIIPGSFAFALNYLVDHELGLAPLDARFKNDEVGVSAPCSPTSGTTKACTDSTCVARPKSIRNVICTA